MPSTSAKQHRFMAAIANNPSFAKKVGVSQSVGKDFTVADKGKTFNKGGMMKKRRFDAGGEIDYEVDENAEPERRSFGSGVSMKKDQPKSSRRIVSRAEAKAIEEETKRNEALIASDKESAIKRGKDSVVEGARKFRSDFSKQTAKETNLRQAARAKQTFNKGGMMKESKAMVGKEMAFMKKKGAPASMIKHEKAEMKGYAKGGGIESRGKTKGTMVRMATGGVVKFAKGGGIELRGKTRGKMC